VVAQFHSHCVVAPDPTDARSTSHARHVSQYAATPVTVHILFPTSEDSPISGGIVPLVVELRERVSEHGVFWAERVLVGVEGLVLLDTKQLSGGTYDAATQEMVYRLTAPLWTMWMPPTETFVWTQAQWVGVPLSERNASAYCEGKATDTVDITVDNNGSLLIAPKGTTMRL
jgi:hypothetical protein